MPADMTDIQRYIAAIGRDFKFSLDHTVDDPIGIPEEGHGVVECVHDLKRFMLDQQHIMRVLNYERCAHNSAKHNALAKNRSFQHGDIVICHRQAQSKMSEWILAKLTYGFTGPFVVLGETESTRYLIPKIRRTLHQETRFEQPRE
jgi:hypothetical protein